MNKRKRTGRIALALLISGIVFLTNTIAMLLTIVAIYGLARLGVIETTGGQVGLPELLRFFFYTSLVIGFLLASLTGKIILKPIKRIIDQLDRLASGDFKTRLHFGKPIADHPTFKQVEKSFNRAAEELDYTEMLILSTTSLMNLRHRSFLSQALQSFCVAETLRTNKKKNTLKSLKRNRFGFLPWQTMY